MFISTSRSEYAPGASAIIDPSKVPDEDWGLPAAEKNDVIIFKVKWISYCMEAKILKTEMGLNNTFQIKYGQNLHRLPSFKKIARFCCLNHR